MDATRHRRIEDPQRQRWYARWRAVRFAQHFGFAAPSAEQVLLKRYRPTKNVSHDVQNMKED